MRNEIDWTTDEFGRARVAGVHDGRILKVAFAYGDYLHLWIKSPSNGLVAVELSGLGDLVFSDFYNTPIVSTVFVWPVRSVPRSSRGASNSGWDLLFASRYKKDDVKETAARIALKRPQSLLVQVECSYGGAIVAICDRVSFFTESKTK